MKFIKLFIPLLMVVACTTPPKVEVLHTGALMEIMSGNIKATTALSTLKDTPNLYALGALEDLQGEIQIFNGEVSVTSVNDGTIHNSNSYDHKAALLVYASVKDWIEVRIPDSATTANNFEIFVRSVATSEGIPTDKPFPFLVEGQVKSIDYHIINWDFTDTVHTHEKHQQSGVKDQLIDNRVSMLGFYSEVHKGVFTHHSTNMHVHFRTEGDQSQIAGHVDGFLLGNEMTLKLPKQ
jgi:acetolactate decarboxylase